MPTDKSLDCILLATTQLSSRQSKMRCRQRRPNAPRLEMQAAICLARDTRQRSTSGLRESLRNGMTAG